MQVENFQPFYRFIPRYMDDLRIGAKILRDHLELEMEKVERAARAKANEKIDAAAAAERVKSTLLYLGRPLIDTVIRWNWHLWMIGGRKKQGTRWRNNGGCHTLQIHQSLFHLEHHHQHFLNRYRSMKTVLSLNLSQIILLYSVFPLSTTILFPNSFLRLFNNIQVNYCTLVFAE